MTFPGFSEDTKAPVRIPDQFFSHVLLEIDNLDELKLTMYIFWRLEHLEGPLHYLRLADISSDPHLLRSIRADPDKALVAVKAALKHAVKRGTLLQASISTDVGKEMLICLNSPKGRAAVAAIQRGEWRVTGNLSQPIDLYTQHPNIFKLYEANIGPLTPLIADALRDAENTYQANWIEDAFQIAVERNKRNWHYIEAILHRWQEGGRDDRKDQQARRDTEEARRRYGEWEK